MFLQLVACWVAVFNYVLLGAIVDCDYAQAELLEAFLLLLYRRAVFSLIEIHPLSNKWLQDWEFFTALIFYISKLYMRLMKQEKLRFSRIYLW